MFHKVDKFSLSQNLCGVLMESGADLLPLPITLKERDLTWKLRLVHSLKPLLQKLILKPGVSECVGPSKVSDSQVELMNWHLIP